MQWYLLVIYQKTYCGAWICHNTFCYGGLRRDWHGRSVCELQPASVENRIYKSPADEVVLGRDLDKAFFFLSGKNPGYDDRAFFREDLTSCTLQYRPDGITERGGIPYKDRKGVVFHQMAWRVTDRSWKIFFDNCRNNIVSHIKDTQIFIGYYQIILVHQNSSRQSDIWTDFIMNDFTLSCKR